MTALESKLETKKTNEQTKTRLTDLEKLNWFIGWQSYTEYRIFKYRIVSDDNKFQKVTKEQVLNQVKQKVVRDQDDIKLRSEGAGRSCGGTWNSCRVWHALWGD